jgi:hypothetical protein
MKHCRSLKKRPLIWRNSNPQSVNDLGEGTPADVMAAGLRRASGVPQALPSSDGDA